MAAPAPSPRHAPPQGHGVWRAAVRDHRLPAAIVAAYALGAFAAGPLLGFAPPRPTPWQFLFFLSNGAVLLACLAAGATVWRRLAIDRESGGSTAAATAWRRAWRDVRARWVTDALLARALVVYLLLAVTSAIFVSWKPVVATAGFGWDARLIAWEAALHGGRQPWELLHPVMGLPWLTRAVDAVYAYGWRATQSLLMFGLAVAPPAPWRMRALVTFALAWVLGGTVAAVAFSSAGPIFVERVHGIGTFVPLTEYLERVHAAGALDVIRTREYLWTSYVRDVRGLWSGISAMPSMHIASTAVLAHAVQAATRGTRVAWLRWVGWGFVVVMLVGSVHLAWHYALDGYASIAGVAALWWLSGRLTTRGG